MSIVKNTPDQTQIEDRKALGCFGYSLQQKTDKLLVIVLSLQHLL
jgi:hypothetical protein